MSKAEIRLVAVFSTLLFILILSKEAEVESEPLYEYERVLITESIEARTTEDIIKLDSVNVIPALYTGINQLESLPVQEAKYRFIDIMLPAILVARYNIAQDSIHVENLRNKRPWSFSDSLFFESVSKRYKTKDTTQLLFRMATHPNSLTLAQAAVESGWGSSRFFRKANNVFGVWSYNENEPRIPASIRRKGYQVFLRKYDDISGSIKNYFETLGRGSVYKSFRKARLETKDPFELANHLIRYSERKEAYILQLKGMIDFNDFERYDTFRISPRYIVQKPIIDD